MKALVLFLISVAAWAQIPLPTGGSSGGGATATCGAVPGQICFNDDGVLNGLTGSFATNDKDLLDNYVELVPEAPTSVTAAFGTTGNGILIKSAAGGATSHATGAAGDAGDVIISTETGGAATGITSPVAGGSGNLTLRTGAGAPCTTGGTSCDGGAARTITIGAGAAGAAAHDGGTKTGGRAFGVAINCGAGGDATGTGTNIGGLGGSCGLTAGDGGSTLNGTLNTGAAGGGVQVHLGSGGTGTTADGLDGTFSVVGGARANANISQVTASGGSPVVWQINAAGSTVGHASANVASNTTTALTGGNLFHITGTNNITTLNNCDSSNNGREVTLIFDGVLTFTDGNNLKLAGNFVTTADDVISLACDGTNWYEKSRSVN